MRASLRFGRLAVAVAAVAVLACGGGGGGGGPAQRTIGGTLSGMTGTGLVLHSSLGEDLALSANGPFAFVNRAPAGTSYVVTVAQQPSANVCSVANGSGTVGDADVTNIAVTCVSSGVTIGGTVSGLSGSGLVLHSSLGEDLPVSANGAFTFAVAAPFGTAYEITVAQHPSSPNQTCVVSNGAGTVGSANVTNVAVDCGTNAFRVGGAVSGVAGTGLALQLVVGNHPVGHGADEEIPISAPGTFTFQTPIPSGTAYAVTVKAHPTSPSQTCSVANGAGTIGGADVTNIAVACQTSRFAVGGTVSGFAPGLALTLNGGPSLSITSNGAFTFPTTLASGSPYVVAVSVQPGGQTCSVQNSGGTIIAGPVTNVAVVCSANSFTVAGTVAGLAAGNSVVLENNLGDAQTVSADGAFTFPTHVSQGGGYSVTVATQPATQRCTVANGSGTATANVTNVAVTCSSVIVRWTAPTTWGALWPDSPTLVQHAYFNGSGIVSAKGPALTWSAGAQPSPVPASGFPAAVNRFGSGPFTAAQYRANADAALAGLTGDMIVCAVVKPDHNPATMANGTEKTIVARGLANGTESVPGGGWVLMQMHHHFCFHYQSTDGTSTAMRMAATPTYFADRDQQDHGPLNPSYVVVCAGRAGGNIAIAANSYEDEHNVVALPSAANLLDVGAHPLTIGGSPTSDPAMAFGGLVYETAVWNEPATPENLQAKLAWIQGLTQPDGTAVRYSRNREAGFLFAGLDGRYHTVWRSGPRIDPQKGLLFGLQGVNRVVTQYTPTDPDQPSRFIATSEAFEEWQATAGAAVAPNQVEPPGDAGVASAGRITLDAGASLTTSLARPFDQPGQVHGQIWLRVPAATTGQLRIRMSAPNAGGSGTFDVDLGSLAAGEWTRLWLYRAPGGAGNELTTDGSQTAPGTVSLENAGSAPIEFSAWGLVLTQLGRGADLGALDPGPEMYDGSLNFRDWPLLIDVLRLPPIPASTAATGYCLSVDVQPALSWNAPFESERTLVQWRDPNAPRDAKIHAPVGDQICFRVGGAPFGACFKPADPPLSWAAGSKHNVKGCVSPSGEVSILADGTLVGNTAPNATAVDLAGGSLRVGGDGDGDVETPWHGYVSKVLACFGGAASCE